MGLIDELGVEGAIIDAMPLGPDSLVWIVGAFKGKTAVLLQERFDPHMVAFDPQPHAIEHLKAIENPKLLVVEAGLSDQKGLYEMRGIGSDACTVYRQLVPGISESRLCPFIRADEVLAPSGHVDLAILNCEGGEFKIIPCLAAAGQLVQFDRLLVQFHYDAAPDLYSPTLRQLDTTHRPTWYEFLPSWGLWERGQAERQAPAWRYAADTWEKGV